MLLGDRQHPLCSTMHQFIAMINFREATAYIQMTENACAASLHFFRHDYFPPASANSWQCSLIWLSCNLNISQTICWREV